MMCSNCAGDYENPDMTAGEPDPEQEPDSTLQDVFAYLRAVKRFGLALQQLGRPCDKVGK